MSSLQRPNLASQSCFHLSQAFNSLLSERQTLTRLSLHWDGRPAAAMPAPPCDPLPIPVARQQAPLDVRERVLPLGPCGSVI